MLFENLKFHMFDTVVYTSLSRDVLRNQSNIYKRVNSSLESSMADVSVGSKHAFGESRDLIF